MTTAVGAMAPDNMLTMMRKANPDTKNVNWRIFSSYPLSQIFTTDPLLD
jgi:hypothetical protein